MILKISQLTDVFSPMAELEGHPNVKTTTNMVAVTSILINLLNTLAHIVCFL